MQSFIKIKGERSWVLYSSSVAQPPSTAAASPPYFAVALDIQQELWFGHSERVSYCATAWRVSILIEILLVGLYNTFNAAVCTAKDYFSPPSLCQLSRFIPVSYRLVSAYSFHRKHRSPGYARVLLIFHHTRFYF